jgi:hypothetical protein
MNVADDELKKARGGRGKKTTPGPTPSANGTA